MQPPAAAAAAAVVKLIPLAPPASAATTRNRTNHAQDNKFNWPAWLSPKLSKPSRLNRRHTDKDVDSPTGRRPRTTSFDGDRLLSPRDNPMLIIPSHSDQAYDTPRQTHAPTKKDPQSSLLTAFLLSLDELLPEYCNHLLSAADMGQSNGASKAIAVLERGSHKLCQVGAKNRESPRFRSLTYGSMRGSDASQSRSPTFSSSQFLKQLSTGSPVKDLRQSQAYDHLQHILSPSILRRSTQESTGSNNTCRSEPSSPSYFDKGMSKTTANEWERFVSPFLMLAAAEVLYGRMEHVIDPLSESEFEVKNRPETKSISPDGDLAASYLPVFRVPFLDCLNNTTEEKAGPVAVISNTARKSPIVSFASRNESPTRKRAASKDFEGTSSKRGSTRLVAIYQQVRLDLVIVGEYLCDPVLGSHAVESSSSPLKNAMPPLPYQDEEPVNQLKPKISNNVYDGGAKDTAETDERRIAALSLRDTLSNLISFIDSRCSLIKIHAEMCSRNQPASIWSTVAKRCEEVSVPSRSMARCEKEAKALKLVLDIVHHMQSFDFFQCTLSIRRLFVLLGPSPNDDRDFLPMMWIRTTFARILSLVQVMFSEAELLGGFTPQPNQQLSRTLSNKKTNHKREGSTNAAPRMLNFDALSSELVASSRSAVAVARKSQDNSWMAVFIKGSSNNKSDQCSELAWPLDIWHQIEKGVVNHYEGMDSNHRSNRSTYEVNCSNTDLEASVKSSNQAISLMRKKQALNDLGPKATCHVAAVSDTVCLIVIKGPEGGRKQKISDEDITRFLETATPLLVSTNVFGIDVVLSAKSLMRKNSAKAHRGMDTLKYNSLWDGLWSEDKQKQMKILNALGLRKSKNSPIIAPLKSPYAKDLRRRRRKKKATLNHGHLALFLGSDLSQIM